MIDFSNDPASVLTLVYECQECFTIKKVVELNTLPELKVANLNMTNGKELNAEVQGQPPIPIEASPQAGH